MQVIRQSYRRLFSHNLQSDGYLTSLPPSYACGLLLFCHGIACEWRRTVCV